MLTKTKALICIFIILLLNTSCAANQESSTVTPAPVAQDNSYQCREIQAPFKNISEYSSHNTVYNPETYTIITGTQDTQTMKNTYQKLEYINNEWKNTTFAIDDKNTMVFGFYRSDNGKLYGESTVLATKVAENSNAGVKATSSPQKGEAHRNIYEINETDSSTKIHSVKKWKDISAKSLCISGKEIYFLNSTDVAQISVLKSGAKGAEKITLPQICNPVSLDILDEEIFLLTTDGIYIGNGSSANSFTKIFDGAGLTIDWEYLSDFRAARDENDYKFYLSSSNESGEMTVNEIKKGNSK